MVDWAHVDELVPAYAKTVASHFEIAAFGDSQNELMRPLITHQFVSKLIPNSPILSNNDELKSIAVNKGRFHEELR